MTVRCPVCSKRARLNQDAAWGPEWTCDEHDMRVGCHPGTIRPLGTMADRLTRKARQQAHEMFDGTWSHKKGRSRREAYADLARELGIAEHECHIARFDKEMCEKVKRVAYEWRRQKIWKALKKDAA